MATLSSDAYGAIAAIGNAAAGLAGVGHMGGRQRIVHGNLVLASAVATGDILRMARLPSNARIISILDFHDDLGTTVPADLGVYDALDDALIDANLYVTAQALGSVQSSFAERRWTILTETTAGDRIWENLGLAVDPNVMYDLAWTVGSVTAGSTGDVAMQVHYTVD